MPIEVALLEGRPSPIVTCPKCGASPFRPFLRGQVQSWLRQIFFRPYCALICWTCKEIVGYE
jgi:hypothetical protein